MHVVPLLRMVGTPEAPFPDPHPASCHFPGTCDCLDHNAVLRGKLSLKLSAVRRNATFKRETTVSGIGMLSNEPSQDEFQFIKPSFYAGIVVSKVPYAMEPIRIRVRTPVPRVATRDLAARDLGPRVLDGCCVEAERADRVGFCLQGLRNALPEHLHPHLTAVIDQLQVTSQLLRDLADKSQVHLSQVPVMIDYLNVILPCLCRTLRDIMGYYEDKFLSKEHRWRTMYHIMSNELPGTTLPARFVMYNQFLGLLNFMLTRDPNFDVNAMEALRLRILQLRDARKIDPPSPIRTDLVRRDTALDFWKQETVRRVIAGLRNPIDLGRILIGPKLYSPSPCHPGENSENAANRMGHLNPFPDNVKILVKRTFDNDRVSVMVFLREADQLPFILVRTRTAIGEPWVSIRPIDNLTIERESTSVLHLTYWNAIERRKKAWASLSFLTWEVTLLTTDLIIAWSSLKTFTRKVAVYTSYPEMVRSRDVLSGQLSVYSFCDEYRPHHQRRGRMGAFQIKFAHATAATRFKQLFNPIPAPSVEDASEERDEEEEDDFTPSED
ncbi:hypothetical protein FHL15_000266 [Xylaria flabelliformis]|uniref:PH domain-containing protein n=1 Tax=Xylaria flabelliformis TaxID=2512241 RepID=A0A553IFF4_9PEZI|nr:hypothetical protein FHL15_000266 [Xylaria flabelliformis]